MAVTKGHEGLEEIIRSWRTILVNAYTRSVLCLGITPIVLYPSH